MNDTIKVRVTVEVEVDRKAYAAEYHVPGAHVPVEEVRAHVKGTVGTAAASAFDYIDAVKVTDWR